MSILQLGLLAALTSFLGSPLLAGDGGEPFTARFYVDSAALDAAGDGSSWASAFKYVQDGLEEAKTYLQTNLGPVEVWVAQGVHRPDQSSASEAGTNSETATFKMLNDISLFGGFVGTESTLAERPLFSEAHVTVLTGEIGTASRDDNSRHVLTGSNSSPAPNNATRIPTLNGFTITGGYADSNQIALGDYGGAFLASSGNYAFANCRFVDNRAVRGGGAICAYNSGTSVRMLNCTFEENEANNGGAVLAQSSATFLANHCLFANNHAVDASFLVGIGGAFYSNKGKATVSYSTFVGNTAAYGGAFALNDGFTSLIQSSVLWGNTNNSGASNTAYLVNTELYLQYDVLEGGVAGFIQQGTNSVLTLGPVYTEDPMFLDAPSGDYRVSLLSSCNDATGNTAGLIDLGDIDQDGDYLEDAPFDLALTPRVTGLKADIGAFESSCEPEVFCEALPNSASPVDGALISATGSCSSGSQDLVFSAGPVPNSPGLFILGMTREQTPFGDGYLCVGGEKSRLAPMRAVNNTMIYAVDWSSPVIQTAFQPGEIRQVQAWFRDPAAGGAGFNTSNAMTVQIQL